VDGPQQRLGTEQRLARVRKHRNKGEMAMGYLHKGALPKPSLYCLLSRRQAAQDQGSIQMMNGGEATIKHKRKLIMIKCKE